MKRKAAQAVRAAAAAAAATKRSTPRLKAALGADVASTATKAIDEAKATAKRGRKPRVAPAAAVAPIQPVASATSSIVAAAASTQHEQKQQLHASSSSAFAASLLTSVRETFESARRPAEAAAMAKYMRGKFEYIGLKKPERSALTKPLLATPPPSEADLIAAMRSLWAQTEREYHYVAMDLALKHKKIWTPAILPVFEELIRSKQWWDTVDLIASNMVGELLRSHANLVPVMDKWIKFVPSSNEDQDMWARRAAILHQLHWKDNTDVDRLFRYIQLTKHEEDFFIRKAIGWVLRQYSKTAPKVVRAFINENKDSLSKLSISEGSKYC